MNWNKSLLSYLIFSALFIFVFYTIDSNDNYKKYSPVPTEYVQKKKDRKLFKKQRDEYIKKMHLSAPDVDWVILDKQNRKKSSTNERDSDPWI